jgi:amino acid permease
MVSYNPITFLINLTLFVVLCIVLFSYVIIMFALLNKLTNKSVNIYAYKLHNKSISFIIAIIYILVFIVFLYALRVSRINNTLNISLFSALSELAHGSRYFYNSIYLLNHASILNDFVEYSSVFYWTCL